MQSKRHNNKIHRQEAIDTLSDALNESISDEKVEKNCCRALLILGGIFSSSGKLMTEDWILKLAGFLSGPDADDESNDISADGIVMKVCLFLLVKYSGIYIMISLLDLYY